MLKTTATSIKFFWIRSDTIGVQGTTVLFVFIQATHPQDMPLPRNKHGALYTKMNMVHCTPNEHGALYIKLHKHVTAS
jgi:hypothetical protein